MVKINYILFYALRKLFDDLNSDLVLFWELFAISQRTLKKKPQNNFPLFHHISNYLFLSYSTEATKNPRKDEICFKKGLAKQFYSSKMKFW